MCLISAEISLKSIFLLSGKFAILKSRENLHSILLERRDCMSEAVFTDSAKVMAKGQVTIPKDVRKALGITPGDRVTFVVEGNTVRMVNSAVFALEIFARQMEGEFEKAGLETDEDVVALVKKVRHELLEEKRKAGEDV